MHPDRTKTAHWKAARRVLHYLKQTADWSLTLGGVDPPQLQGYCDSSWGDEKATRRSTLGYCFSMGSGAISWKSQMSKVVALSTGEAEYYAAGEAAREAQWLKQLTETMGITTIPYIIHCDSRAALCSLKNPVISARNKHIEIRHHFIRDLVEEGAALFMFVPSKRNLADGLTKALPQFEHNELFRRMMKDWDKGEWPLEHKNLPLNTTTSVGCSPPPKKQKYADRKEASPSFLALVFDH